MDDLCICIKCKKRPVYIKSRGLCQSCVSLFYYERRGQNKSEPSRYNKVRFSKEMDFVKNFFHHNNWMYQPAYFRLNGGGYHPDFYDGERKVFIEVAGTRQAFHENRVKYEQFIKKYPKIDFEIRYSTGELLKDMKFHIPEKR